MDTFRKLKTEADEQHAARMRTLWHVAVVVAAAFAAWGLYCASRAHAQPIPGLPIVGTVDRTLGYIGVPVTVNWQRAPGEAFSTTFDPTVLWGGGPQDADFCKMMGDPPNCARIVGFHPQGGVFNEGQCGEAYSALEMIYADNGIRLSIPRRTLVAFCLANVGAQQYWGMTGCQKADRTGHPEFCTAEEKCGNRKQDAGETCATCPQDMKPAGICNAPPRCGDGKPDHGETCASCPADIGACPPPPPVTCAAPNVCGPKCQAPPVLAAIPTSALKACVALRAKHKAGTGAGKLVRDACQVLERAEAYKAKAPSTARLDLVLTEEVAP